MQLQYFFVYGTLRSDAKSVWHERLIKPFFTFTGTGSVPGTLYSLGEYPGLVECNDGNSLVTGEIYSFDAETTSFSGLDEYEGCAISTPLPHDYVRKKTTVILDDGSTVDAWCYFFLGKTDGMDTISAWEA